jgi:hypothetical protein
VFTRIVTIRWLYTESLSITISKRPLVPGPGVDNDDKNEALANWWLWGKVVGVKPVPVLLHAQQTSHGVALGCLVVACLSLDPQFACSNPTKDDGFLRRSTTFFRADVKPSFPRCKILQHVKETYEYERYFVGKIQKTTSRQVSHPSLLDISAGSIDNCPRAMVDKSGMVKNRMGLQNWLEIIAVKGSPLVPTP